MQKQMQLAAKLQIGNLKKQTLGILRNNHRADIEHVVPHRPLMHDRVLARPISRGITVIPSLRKLLARIVGRRRVDSARKIDTHSVLMDMETRWQNLRVARIPKPLEASCGRSVSPPAMHARGVNPSVLRADPRSMHPRAEVSWQWTKCTLPLRANSVPKQKMHRSCTK